MLEFFRRADPAIARIEDFASPLELAEIAANGRYRFDQFKIAELGPEALASPRLYRRRMLSRDAALYSAGLGADRLLICFSDRMTRLMTPVSVVLQCVDERRHDILFLADPRELHYDGGVQGLGGSWGELAGALRRIAAEGGYRDLLAFGASLGGFAALRGGRLAGARRAVSIGGRGIWHISRLRDNAGPIGAFDPLCGCVASDTDCIALYGEDNRDDGADARQLAGVKLVELPCRKHNVVQQLLDRGRLKPFLDHLFDAGREPSPAFLRSLMADDGSARR